MSKPTNTENVHQLRIAPRPPHTDPIVFAENHNITHDSVVRENETRRPLPISTIQFGDPRLPTIDTFIPRSGMDLLYGIPSIHIEQSLEIYHSAASQNQFTIRSPTNDAIYAATESSSQRDKLIYGSKRPFYLYLLDKTHQEAISFRRKLRLGSLCFQPQYLEVWTAPGNFLGYVREKMSLYTMGYSITDRDGRVVANVVGPSKFICSCQSSELYLKVLNADYTTQLGAITRIWNTDISAFTQNIYFSDPCMDVKDKALFLGAAFLAEYMFFQSTSCFD